MIDNRISLFRNNEFEFSVHSFVIWEAILISWTLATGIFPYYYKYLSAYTYWWMGITGVVALFFSVLIHEAFSIFIWCKTGLPFKGVTVYLFGAVTEAETKIGQGGKELLVLICCPLINIMIAFLMHCILIIGQSRSLPLEIMGVIEFVRMINILLIVINLFPLLPFDGGRIALVILNRLFNNVKNITIYMTSVSTVAGLILMAAGVLLCLKGYIQGGVWWILLGMYLREGSCLINRKYLLQNFLRDEKVESIMTANPICVSPQLSVYDFVHQYIYNYHFKVFPIVNESSKISSVVFSRSAFDLSPEEWNNYTVGEIASLQMAEITISAGTDVLSVIGQMYETEQSRMIVIDNERRLLGIVVLKDLLGYLSAKIEL